MVIGNRVRVHQTLLILVYVMFSTSADDQNQVQRKLFRLNAAPEQPWPGHAVDSTRRKRTILAPWIT